MEGFKSMNSASFTVNRKYRGHVIPGICPEGTSSEREGKTLAALPSRKRVERLPDNLRAPGYNLGCKFRV